MNILFINTLYHPYSVGGAERSVKILAEGLAKLDHQVSVLTLSEHQDSQEEINGVTVYRLKIKNLYFPFDGKKRNILKKVVWHLLDSCNIFYTKKIISLIRDIKPDIVNANNLAGFSPYLLKIVRKNGIPIISTLRDYYYLCNKTTLYHGKCKIEGKRSIFCKITSSKKIKYLNNYPNAIIGISNFILEKYKSYGLINKATYRIFNPVLLPACFNNTNEKDEYTIGYIGKISENKGVANILEILSSNAFLSLNWKLLIAGKGDKEYVEKLKASFESNRIFFLGHVESKHFYRQIDLLLVPSLWEEPFGRVAIEGASHGIPVLANKKGGLKEIIDTVGSVEALSSETLRRYIVERTKVNKKDSRKDLTPFMVETHLNSWLSLAHDIVKAYH